VGFLPEGGHELDGLDRLFRVELDSFAIGLNFAPAPRPQVGIGEGGRIANGVAERLSERVAFGI